VRQWQWLLNAEREDPLIFKSVDGLWRSWLAHHKLAAVDRFLLEQQMQEKAIWWRYAVAHALMVAVTVSHPLTFHEKTVGVVANCHKEPAQRFERRLHTLEEITQTLVTLIGLIRSVNARAPIVLTLSPIRNTTLGFVINFLGKAMLRVAMESVLQEHQDVYYFPAYEIMMDDLRDYRYYAADMIHPTEQAAEYIAEKFCDAFLSPSALMLHQEGSKRAARCLHRSFSPMAEDNSVALKEALHFVQNNWPSVALLQKERWNSLFIND
jgi:hypothetical protein